METYVYDFHDDIITSSGKVSNKKSIVEILLSIPPEKKQEFLKLYQDGTYMARYIGYVRTLGGPNFKKICKSKN